jgi:long-chain fatty acid transport protein
MTMMIFPQNTYLAGGSHVRKTLTVVAAMMLGIVVFSSASFGAGFTLPDQDAAAMGMASAFVGQADNPSAVWYNPAGMTQLDGTRISGGVIGIYPVLTHENNTINPGTTDVSKREIHVPFNLYATNKLSDTAAFGLGINNPFGLTTNWDQNASSTRYVATFTNLVTTEFNPNIAFKLNNSLSIALGIAYVHLRATLEKITPTSPFTDANFRLSGDADGWGVNAALKYRASNAVNLGLSYRSRIKEDVEGTADVNGTPLSGNAKTSITLPDLIQFGVSYKASDDLTLNADMDYTMWSTFDRLVIESNVPQFNTTEEHQWKDVWSLRVGGQYALSDQWKLRTGYLYDQSPVKEAYFETRIPDADRQGVSFGVGYATGNITIDAAYMYLRFNNRTISNSQMDDAAVTPKAPNALNGDYKSTAQLAGITVGYKF